MNTIISTQSLQLMHDAIKAAYAVNDTLHSLAQEHLALDESLIYLGNVGYSETGFKWGGQQNNAQPDPQRLLAAAHALIEKLDAEGSPAAAREQEELIDALEQYETSQQRGGN